MDVLQVAHGRLRWLSPEEGGLRQPFGSGRWVRPAWIEPGDIDHVASLVLEDIRPGAACCDGVKASWLAWELLPASEWTLNEGDNLAITEGTRPVAYFTVERIEEAVTERLEPPFNRWGRVEAPLEAAGAYRLVEIQSAEGRKKPPPADEVRVWQRRPGVEDDHDDNWTVWLHRAQLVEWMAAVTISEWLPEGEEPDWGRP